MNFEDNHRRLLQTIIQAGVMSSYDMKQNVMRLFDQGMDEDTRFHIAQINSKLEPIDMSIKTGRCEFTGETYYMLAFTSMNTVTRFQKEFSQAQLELLRKVFTMIVDSDDGSVSSTVCLNSVSNMENKITVKNAEECLNNAVQRKWLNIKNGKYYMGVRSIIELMPYFRHAYQAGFNKCHLCKNAIFYGRRCGQCHVISHLYCLAAFAKFQNPLKCTNCNHVIPADGLPEVENERLDAMDLEVSTESLPGETMDMSVPSQKGKKRLKKNK